MGGFMIAVTFSKMLTLLAYFSGHAGRFAGWGWGVTVMIFAAAGFPLFPVLAAESGS
jgi:hypothetical protein